MTEELDFERLIKLADKMDSPQTSLNLKNINEGLANLDKILGSADKVLNFIEKLEQRPSISMLIRASAQKNGLSLEPLQAIRTGGGIEPASKTHEQFFIQLNKLPEAELQKQLQQLSKAQEKYAGEQSSN